MKTIGFKVVWAILGLLSSGGCGLAEPETVGKEPESPNPYGIQISIDSHPSWSPDGRTIAYTHWPQSQEEARLGGSGDQIWLLELATGKRRFVTSGWEPAWSPDGARLAFVRGVLGSGDIYTVELETGEVTRITDWGWNFHPSWSPDGRRIVYFNNSEVGSPRMGIWIKSLSGGGNTRIREQGWDSKLSPDGARILYTWLVASVKEGTPEEIFVVDTTGKNPVQLTSNIRYDRFPSWSPDGEWITWESYGPRKDPLNGIWIMRADGSGKRLLIPGGQLPSWSPDGKRIVYYAFFDSVRGGLWVMNANGTDAHPLIPPEVYGIPKQPVTVQER